MGRTKLTINDWKKRALDAESEISGYQARRESTEKVVRELNDRITELEEDLRWANESNTRLRFMSSQQAAEFNSLVRVAIFLGDRIPEKEYHNCEESLRNGNQCFTAKNTIDYDKNHPNNQD